MKDYINNKIKQHNSLVNSIDMLEKVKEGCKSCDTVRKSGKMSKIEKKIDELKGILSYYEDSLCNEIFGLIYQENNKRNEGE